MVDDNGVIYKLLLFDVLDEAKVHFDNTPGVFYRLIFPILFYLARAALLLVVLISLWSLSQLMLQKPIGDAVVSWWMWLAIAYFILVFILWMCIQHNPHIQGPASTNSQRTSNKRVGEALFHYGIGISAGGVVACGINQQILLGIGAIGIGAIITAVGVFLDSKES